MESSSYLRRRNCIEGCYKSQWIIVVLCSTKSIELFARISHLYKEHLACAEDWILLSKNLVPTPARYCMSCHEFLQRQMMIPSSRLLAGFATRRRGVGAASRTAVVVAGTVVIGVVVGAIAVGVWKSSNQTNRKQRKWDLQIPKPDAELLKKISLWTYSNKRNHCWSWIHRGWSSSFLGSWFRSVAWWSSKRVTVVVGICLLCSKTEDYELLRKWSGTRRSSFIRRTTSMTSNSSSKVVRSITAFASLQRNTFISLLNPKGAPKNGAPMPSRNLRSRTLSDRRTDSLVETTKVSQGNQKKRENRITQIEEKKHSEVCFINTWRSTRR